MNVCIYLMLYIKDLMYSQSTSYKCKKSSNLLANDGDDAFILIFVSGEEDAGAGGITDLADIGSITANQEAVVLWLGTHLRTHIIHHQYTQQLSHFNSFMQKLLCVLKPGLTYRDFL